MAGDGKYDSPGAGNLMKTFYLDSFLGWAAKYCTYIVQSLQTKKIVGLWVADKSMVISHKYLNKLTNQVKEKLFSLWWNILDTILDFKPEYKYIMQVTSSSKMESLAAKSVIVNLAVEHQLVMDSVTTDRSSDLRAMLRWDTALLVHTATSCFQGYQRRPARRLPCHYPPVWCVALDKGNKLYILDIKTLTIIHDLIYNKKILTGSSERLVGGRKVEFMCWPLSLDTLYN